VAFKITREASGVISAKVISVKRECRAGYHTGDVFKLSLVGGEPSAGTRCYLNRIDSLSVSVVSHSRLCRYYQRPGRSVPFERLIPPGFCLPAYYAAYPYALSLLYDGVNFEKIGREHAASLTCHNSSDCIHMRVRTKRNIFSPLLNFVETVLRALGFPKDVLDKTVEIQVVGSQGNCVKDLTAGRIVYLNLYNREELCPALFHNLFPFIVMLDKRVFPYWAEERRRIDVHCPNAAADIVYRIDIKSREAGI
jgi:uncharacterized repeat protein (TIGR04076 family)